MPSFHHWGTMGQISVLEHVLDRQKMKYYILTSIYGDNSIVYSSLKVIVN